MKCLPVMVFFVFSSFSLAQTIESEPTANEVAISGVGDVVQLALPFAAGLSTLILGDKEGTWQFLKSFGTTVVLTYALKYAIDKPRPNPSMEGRAFPSGHTATAFSGASFIQRRFGWAYGLPAYALAGFVGYSRLQGNTPAHDGWDVLAGAVIGIGSTYLFTTPYQKEHYELGFSNEDDTYLLGFKYTF